MTWIWDESSDGTYHKAIIEIQHVELVNKKNPEIPKCMDQLKQI